jgi:calmodulin
MESKVGVSDDEAAAYIASLTDDEIRYFKKAFQGKDPSGAGRVDAEQVADLLRSMDLDLQDSEIKEMVQYARSGGENDASASIDYQGFLVMMARKMRPPFRPEELKEAFQAFDADGSGTVSPAEFRATMALLGEGLFSKNECDALLRAVDSDGDGDVTYKEFVDIFAKDHSPLRQPLGTGGGGGDDARAMPRGLPPSGKNGAPAPPPDEERPWREMLDDKGVAYYYNTMTRETQWEKPAGFVGNPDGSSTTPVKPFA